MKIFTIFGMSCAACSAKIEKTFSELKEVNSCSVNLLTNQMNIETNLPSEEIIGIIRKIGYDAIENTDNSSKSKNIYDELSKKNTTKIVHKLIISSILLVFLFYINMGKMIFNYPLPSFLSSPNTAGIIQMLLSLTILIINRNFFINGIKGVIHKSPNMDTLICLGSGISFLWSSYVLIKMFFPGNHQPDYNLYFESSAMILVLITLGKLFESISKGKTTDAIQNLIKLSPQTATILKNNKEIQIPVADIQINDVFILKPGYLIPVDGIVIEGQSSINEASITGESIPVDKQQNNKVYSGTTNLSGYLKCKALKTEKDSTICKIIELVSNTAATKAPIAKLADKISGYFVPAVICISLITFIIWMIIGENISFCLERAITVLVISCPCSLGLATPVAIMVGNGVGAKNGILFKTAESLETTGKIKKVIFDKTGTLTKGQPEVTDCFLGENITQNELFQTAVDLETKSEHPLAKAISKKAEKLSLKPQKVEKFEEISGKGIKAKYLENNTEIQLYGGNWKFVEPHIQKYNSSANQIQKNAEKAAEKGQTPIYFVKDGILLGAIYISDTIKENARDTIKQLAEMGIESIMVTGDNEITAKEIAKQVDINKIYAAVLPEDKAKIIIELQKTEPVAMVGDGINDAPALITAQTGIAIGNGTDIAIDAANVVLVKNNLSDIPALIKLSRNTLKTIKQNLFWAFFYNVIGITIASGCFASFGLFLNPMIGAAAMSLSSIFVVTNALKLNFFKS